MPDNVIQLIGKEWMLVTAGNENSFNTMTASWGGMGYIWERPSTFIFIRDTRYTYQFLQQHESFTLSFFNEKYRNALRICGTMSGRNTDKVKEAGLTSLETPLGLMSFEEARMIIECKKMFVQELDYANLTEPYKSKIMEEAYKNEPSKHQMFISEIIFNEILVNYSFSLVKDQSVFGQFLEFIVFSVYLRPHFLKYHLYIIVPIIRIY